MTENKRFNIYNKETFDTYIEDTQDLYSDGTPKTYWFEENEDFCALFDLLNELNDENTRLHQTIQEAYETERTHIGRNVLRQLLEAIQ